MIYNIMPRNYREPWRGEYRK